MRRAAARSCVLMLALGAAPESVLACPICDLGGRDTALFIVSVFGFFILGMLCFLFWALKRGALQGQEALADAALRAEEKNQKERHEQ